MPATVILRDRFAGAGHASATGLIRYGAVPDGPGRSAALPAVPAEAGIDQITPSFLPTFTKASIARSICAGVCAALICVRMRAWPCGTTG